MKRQELLKQLDETVDRLEKELAETKKQIRQFKEEENQRVPKWVKRIAKPDPRVRLGHWYKVIRAKVSACGLEIRDENGGTWDSSFPVDITIWEPCYSDNPPEEKKSVRILEGKEKIAADDIIVWNDHLVSIGENIAGIPVYNLAGYPKTVAIRIEKEE